MALRHVRTVELPMTAAAVRPYLKIDDAGDDLELELMIAAMADRAGQETGRSVAKVEWSLSLDAFPSGEIRLPWPPLVSVQSVQYIDAGGLPQTLPESQYVLDAESEPGWLLPAADTDWPATKDCANAVTVAYTAGYGAACPEAIRLWMLAYIAAHHRSREAINVGNIVTKLPHVDGLLDRYRNWSV